MICSACGVANSADSKFCKACGREITADAFPAFVPSRESVPPTPEQRADQLKRTLEMAFWHSDAGNDASAIKAAQAALAIDSDCVSALSLLGCLYERSGRTDLAIEAFERVVDANPDSVADAEKLHALRNGVHLASIPQPPSYRWLPPVLIGFVTRYPSAPLIGGVSTAFLVVFVGLLILVPYARGGSKPMPTPTTVASNSVAANSMSQSQAPAESAMIPAIPTLGAAPAEAGSGPSQTIVPTPKGSTDPFANFPVGVNDERIGRYPSRTQRRAAPGPLPPIADTNGLPSVLSLRPIDVPSSSNNTNFNTVPQHQLEVEAPSGQTAPLAPASDGPAPPPSHISITFSNGPSQGNVPGYGPGAGRSGQIAEDSGGAFQQQAIQEQNKGDYRTAETSYRSAIGAYKNDISSGRNVDFARRGIDACETGIQICRASE